MKVPIELFGAYTCLAARQTASSLIILESFPFGIFLVLSRTVGSAVAKKTVFGDTGRIISELASSSGMPQGCAVRGRVSNGRSENSNVLPSKRRSHHCMSRTAETVR